MNRKRMVGTEEAPAYYRNAEPHYHSFLKEVFTRVETFEELKRSVANRKIYPDMEFLDSVYLMEAKTFLRRSVFDLLAYKHLVCGKHLPMSKVALYYCYFDSISCLLRIRGQAVVHISDLPEEILDRPKKLTFTVTQHQNHTFSLAPFGGNEHQFVWNEFHKLFPDLSSSSTGRLFTEDRYEWNYGLLYSSQVTEEHLLMEVRDRCENNFLDPEFEHTYTEEQAEHIHDLIADYGHEEMYAGNLIQECMKIFVNMAKRSEHASAYPPIFKRIKNEIDMFESRQSLKNVLKAWCDESLKQLG